MLVPGIVTTAQNRVEVYGDGDEGALLEAPRQMTESFEAFERSVLDALTGEARPIHVVDGADGSGLTRFLLMLRDQLGENRCQYLDFERVASTPERFLRSIRVHTPFVAPDTEAADVGTPRAAFLAALHFLCTATSPDGQPAMFLIDEALEVRTFENFPGLRTVATDFLKALAASPNSFVMTTRFGQRARRLLRSASDRYRQSSISALGSVEVSRALNGAGHTHGPALDLAESVRRLTQGRPAYVRALASALSKSGPTDPVAALVEQMTPGGELYGRLRYSYELRLHRARGYGALKAILDVLAEEQPLTLTEISQRLHRTPGSTKDYLSWLEDVDLVAVERKRYSFRDPLLRLWVQLHCQPDPLPSTEAADRVRHFAADALLETQDAAPRMNPTVASDARARNSGIIEID